jgi:hypothetical protein
MPTDVATQRVELWLIGRLVEYARNPRKNDAAVDRMCSSIREFGFKIPCLVRSDGEVVDGHLRLKAARKLGITEIPVILCDEWTPAQVKAFRLMVNRSVTWADWDEELLAIELQEIQESDFDLTLTGFDVGEIDKLLALDRRRKSQRRASVAGVRRVQAWRLVAPGRAQGAVRRCHQRRSRRASSGGTEAPAYGDGPTIRYRTRLRVAGPGWPQRLRARPAQLHEEAHQGTHRDDHLR